MTVVVLVVALVVAVGTYLTWTAGRLDRLTSRAATAWATLDAQLVRRSAAAAELAAHARRHRLVDEVPAKAMEDAALLAREADAEEREDRENDLSRAIRHALADAGRLRGEKTERLLEDLQVAVTRVGFARQFYNDAVRDDRRLRRRTAARLLARRRPVPGSFFEIDDTAVPVDVLGRR